MKPEYQSKSYLEDLDKSFPFVLKELKKVGVTKKILWTAYKTKDPGGVGSSHYCDHLNKYLKNHQFSYVFEHKAADKLIIDFAGKKLYLTDYGSGGQVPVEFFVGILFLFSQGTDMREGFYGLFGLVRKHVPHDLMSGEIFIFINKLRDKIKLLMCDSYGFAICYKKLEKGTF